MRFSQVPRLLSALALSLCCASAIAQSPPPEPPQHVPAKPLTQRQPQTSAEAAEAERIGKLAIVNGRPYDQPSTKDILLDYVHDTYGWPGLIRTSARAGYAQIKAASAGSGKQWGTDFPGFMQRFGSSAGVTGINGNVRLGMELMFHEDLRYIPCHGCRKRDKVMNTLLSEVTARHDENGHRFFTLTPTVADFSGPIISHAAWYPTFDPMAGVIATRLVFATRVGQHLFQEFVWERRHHDDPYRK